MKRCMRWLYVVSCSALAVGLVAPGASVIPLSNQSQSLLFFEQYVNNQCAQALFGSILCERSQGQLAYRACSQQRYRLSRPVPLGSPNYNPAMYGYGPQSAFQNMHGDVYYQYPFYNGGLVRSTEVPSKMHSRGQVISDADYWTGIYQDDECDAVDGQNGGGNLFSLNKVN